MANGSGKRTTSKGPASAALRQRATTSFSRTFASFSNYNYRLYWFGQLISVIGTWISRVAMAWLVLKLTNSSFDLGLVGTLQFLPLTIFALVGGVLADRVPKRRLLVCTQAVLALQSLALAVLITTGVIQIWHIYVLALVQGLAKAFDNPTRQAFVSEMVGTENLSNAVALNSSLFNTARIIGPAIGGFLIAAFSMSVPFYIDTISFLAVIGGLLAMRPAEFHNVPKPSRGPVLRRMREGISYAARTPEVALVLIVMGFIGTFGYNFTTILPLVAKFVLGTGALGFGSLLTAMGVGSLLAALAMAYINRPTQRLLLVGAVGFTFLLGALALSTMYLLTIGILVVLGFLSITFTSTANSRLQLNAPGELRGRVMSLYIFFNAGTAPLGTFLLGWLGERYNVQLAVGAMDAMCVVGVLLALFYLARLRSRQPVPAREHESAPAD
ncbi:MAG TPA: MFS transporter [Thermomicrobiaceae bacterium]|nr:MFS transporter [Thermomicrobiaceae bacterium]